MQFQNLSILICAKALSWVTTLLLLGCKINLKMLQAKFSPNELTLGLEDVGWGLVLVCIVVVQPFSKGENCVFLCNSKICQF